MDGRRGGAGHGMRRREWTMSAPSLGWLVVFFAIPTTYILVLSFRPANPLGGVGEGWSLESWRRVFQPEYYAIYARTAWISGAATAICLLLGTPVAYTMARAPARTRAWLLTLVVVPFWTNFLVRIFAWKVLLHPDGLIRHLFGALRLIGPEVSLLNRPEAVLLVLVYTYLPFAILPIYAAADSFDFGLLEAARDLGASRFSAIVRVFLPGIRRGLGVAALLVLIPALGSYLIPDLVGGTRSVMVGNKITQRAFTDRNWPEAAALASLLTVAVFVPLLAVLRRPGSEAGR